MSRTINEIANGGAVLGEPVARKAREVKDDLLKLAQAAPGQLNVKALTETTQLSPATRKILSITSSIKQGVEDEHGDADEVGHRQKLATILSSRIKTLRSTYSAVTGESAASYIEDDELTSEATFEELIPDLHERNRGPKTFGELTNDPPSFPLLGAILELPPYGNLRDIFSVIGSPSSSTRGVRAPTQTKLTLELIKPGIDVSVWGGAHYLRVDVHGITLNLHLGQPGQNTEEMNLLGTDWLEKGGLALIGDYSAKGRGCAVVSGNDLDIVRQIAPSPEA